MNHKKLSSGSRKKEQDMTDMIDTFSNYDESSDKE